MAFGWQPRDEIGECFFIQNLHPAVLILDRTRLLERYRVQPFTDIEIWHDTFDGEKYEESLLEAEERIYAEKVLLSHGLLAVVEAIQ
jgi:hypothetical protein